MIRLWCKALRLLNAVRGATWRSTAVMQSMVVLTLAVISSIATAGPAPDEGATVAAPDTLTASQWLMRMHEGSRRRAYTGTFVVSSAEGGMSSSRIWHVCDGTQQLQRVDNLTGSARSTFRKNDRVVTFLPDRGVVRTEIRESNGLFPNLLKSDKAGIDGRYTAKYTGIERVAGLEADVVVLAPRDGFRFGYRLWSERRTGLTVKLQTLDARGRVLEQSAFSELQLDAPVRTAQLEHMMAQTQGYRIEQVDLQKTTASEHGWKLDIPVGGFQSMSCYKRPMRETNAQAGVPDPAVLQWAFSDGLATVSLFIETFDGKRHLKEGVMASGASHALTRRMGQWWLTVVGEVPPQTLSLFAAALSRQ